MTAKDQNRVYSRKDSVVFCKTKAAFGGLSNMAAGFPLCVNGIAIRTSEALYQACRFPFDPDIQRLIIEQKSPMSAKMKSKPYRAEKTRKDWDQINVKVMRWSLRVKLAQNWDSFRSLVLSTGDKPIVEESRKDPFWGARKVDEDRLEGMNVLGRLLMELRQQLLSSECERLREVDPPPGIKDFLLDGTPIDRIGLAVDGPKDTSDARRP